MECCAVWLRAAARWSLHTILMISHLSVVLSWCFCQTDLLIFINWPYFAFSPNEIHGNPPAVRAHVLFHKPSFIGVRCSNMVRPSSNTLFLNCSFTKPSLDPNMMPRHLCAKRRKLFTESQFLSVSFFLSYILLSATPAPNLWKYSDDHTRDPVRMSWFCSLYALLI